MPKTNRKPGVHLHKSVPTIAEAQMGIGNEYYWILIASNGKTIAKSSETYKRKAGAVRSMVVAAEIFTGHKPIEYFDHTRKDGGNWVEF